MKIPAEELEEIYRPLSPVQDLAIVEHEGRVKALIHPDTAKAVEVSGGEVDWGIYLSMAALWPKLPPEKRVTEILLTHLPLPRSPRGELLREELPSRVEQALKGDLPPLPPEIIGRLPREDQALLENPKARAVWDYLSTRYPHVGLHPNHNLRFHLGIDSLDWFDLAPTLDELCDVTLAEPEIGRVHTVRDLLYEATHSESTHVTPNLARLLSQPRSYLSDKDLHWIDPLSLRQRAETRMLYLGNRLLMDTYFKVTGKGHRDLPKEQVLFCPNHLSVLDSLAISALMPYRRMRETSWAAWRGFAFDNRVLRWVSKRSHAVPLDPYKFPISSMAYGAAVLAEGRSLIWYPEGRRSPHGRIQRFLKGVGHLVEHYRLPVVPVHIRGAYEAMPLGFSRPKSHPIHVEFGAPITAEALIESGAGSSPPERIVHAIKKAIVELGERS